jgi:hypothetical protein
MPIILASLLFGVVCGIVAHHKARNALGWFITGCCIGPFGLVVALLPMTVRDGVTRRCPNCLEVVRAEARLCRCCASQLSS